MIVNPPGTARGILLFGPGAGGDPARYEALIEAAAYAGFIVTSPIHNRFDSRTVTDEQIRERAVGLAVSLRELDRQDLPVIAAGHSVGGWAALCLAGAQPWGRDRRRIPVPVEPRVTKVVALPPSVMPTPGLDHKAFVETLAADFVEALG